MDTEEYYSVLKKHLTDLVREDKVPIISKTLCTKIRYREKYMSSHSYHAPVAEWPSEKSFVKHPRFIVEAQYSLDEIVKRILNKEEPDIPF